MSFQHPTVEEHDPLKQGLKLGALVDAVAPATSVEEHDPLKQGLKHHASIPSSFHNRVEEHDPLKQGLKQDMMTNAAKLKMSRRA